MDAQHRRLLTRRRVPLLDRLKLEPILPVLEEAQILEPVECSQLVTISKQRQQNIAFLDMLKQSGPKAFPTFLEALKVEQPDLASLLSVAAGEDEVWSNPSSKGGSRQVSREGSNDQDVQSSQIAKHLEAIGQDELEELEDRYRDLSIQPLPVGSPPKEQEHIKKLEALASQDNDRPVAGLSVDCRTSLCKLLDRKHPFGDDWRQLYILLGLPKDKIGLLEESWTTTVDSAAATTVEESPTEQTLFVWEGRVGKDLATISQLATALLTMNRRDAVEIISVGLEEPGD